MNPPIRDVMELCCELATDDEQIRATAMDLAPRGVFVVVRGLLVCRKKSGEVKPLPQIIIELAFQQQQRLYEDVVAVLGNMQWTDLAQTAALVMGNAALKQQVTAALLGYISKELQAEVA